MGRFVGAFLCTSGAFFLRKFRRFSERLRRSSLLTRWRIHSPNVVIERSRQRQYFSDAAGSLSPCLHPEIKVLGLPATCLDAA